MHSEHLHVGCRDIDWVMGGDRVHNAFVLIEGFDHYQASLAGAKGWGTPSSMPAGRFGGQAYGANSTAVRGKSLPATYTTLFCGFAVNLGAANNGPQDIFCLFNGGTGGTKIFRVGYDATGRIIVRTSGGTTVATGTTVLASGTWYYIEFKAVINGASGSCEVRLNGAAEIATTTGNFGSSAADAVGAIGQSAINSYDDLYVLDTTGAAPRNTYLGDIRVTTIYPDGDGNYGQWTPSAAGSHFNKVNESSGTFPDGDTTYVSDATVGHIDTYTFGNVDGGATVFGVQRAITARKDDAGVRQIAPVLREAGTDYVGATVTLGSTYACATDIENQDGAAADWTAAAVNAAEFGVKTIA